MNNVELAEFYMVQDMFNLHAEQNKNTNKKCDCYYCDTYCRAVSIFTKYAKDQLNYNK